VRPVVARAVVAVARDELYARLADLPSHWRIAGRWVEPIELDEDGGLVRLRGPFGVVRVVRTSLDERAPPRRLAGTAVVGGTEARIAWTLDEEDGSTLVTLRADLVRITPWDRMILVAFGRRWLAGRFRATLSRLA
jgi:hypothetical protein